MHPVSSLLEKRIVKRKEVMIVHLSKALLYFGVAGIVLFALIGSIGMIIGFFIDHK